MSTTQPLTSLPTQRDLSGSGSPLRSRQRWAIRTRWLGRVGGVAGDPVHLGCAVLLHLVDGARIHPQHGGPQRLSLRMQVRETLLAYDAAARRALDLLDHMQMALVGIGTCEIVAPLVAGDNFFTAEQFAHATQLGAVGQVNLRFIAEDGTPVRSELDDLVVGVTLEQLHRTRRVLAVAGGPSKYRAIRAALLGGWVNALVTDLATAEFLISD